MYGFYNPESHLSSVKPSHIILGIIISRKKLFLEARRHRISTFPRVIRLPSLLHNGRFPAELTHAFDRVTYLPKHGSEEDVVLLGDDVTGEGALVGGGEDSKM